MFNSAVKKSLPSFSFIPAHEASQLAKLYGHLFVGLIDSLKVQGLEAEEEMLRQIQEAIDSQEVVLSSALLSRLFSEDQVAHSRGVACTTWDISSNSLSSEQYFFFHRLGVGLGFDASSLDDPITFTRQLNDLAISSLNAGGERRLIGDSVTLSIAHPRVMEFIAIKQEQEIDPCKWRLALNVRMPSGALQEKKYAPLVREIATGILKVGDPGVIFWDRFLARSTNPAELPRIAVAPCAEVALSRGEGCVFSYLNVGAIHLHNPKSFTDRLAILSNNLTKLLDLFISVLDPLLTRTQLDLRITRRIGIGICGYADLLERLGVRYGSVESLELARLISSILQYHSKTASAELAEQYGPCPASTLPDSVYRKRSGPINRLGLASHPSIPATSWEALAERVRRTGIRNSTTVVFPPTGKSSAFIGASPGIEPYSSRPGLTRSEAISTASASVPWQEQIDIAAVFNSLSDESVSKTVAFSSGATVNDVQEALLYAEQKELCGITGYVVGPQSRLCQE